MRSHAFHATAAAALGTALAFVAGTAFATGSASADLGAGGTAKGDISTVDGETDTITVHMLEGEPFDVKFKAGFSAGFEIRDPDGAAVEIAFTPGGRSFTASGLVAEKEGAYDFLVTSTGEDQGFWKLSVKPAWPKSVAVGPIGQQTVSLPILGGSVVSGVFRAAPGATVNIPGLYDPQQVRLTAPVVGTGRTAKLPATNCPTSGTHTLDVGASSGEMTGVVTIKVPRIETTNATLNNGLAPVSFDGDGVADVFRQQCAGCHSWAAAYPGVRGLARQSLSLMKAGKMPTNGRVPTAQIQLVDAWIRTGMQR